MTLRPLGDRILLQRIETKQTKGGIAIPDTAKENSQEARVIAAGPGKVDEKGRRSPTEVKKGERVLVRRYAGTEIEIDGKNYVVVTEDEILGVID